MRYCCWTPTVARSHQTCTSERLTPGHVYTRAELAEQFGIKDATLMTGIFRPKGHDSIWLFITDKKTSDRTQYRNRLDHNQLEFESQPAGRKDKLIIEHDAMGLEVLLFYRQSVREYPGAGFRYEGPFRYVSHEGEHPTRFVLQRVR
jgi:putative restriction endonuclease